MQLLGHFSLPGYQQFALPDEEVRKVPPPPPPAPPTLSEPAAPKIPEPQAPQVKPKVDRVAADVRRKGLTSLDQDKGVVRPPAPVAPLPQPAAQPANRPAYPARRAAAPHPPTLLDLPLATQASLGRLDSSLLSPSFKSLDSHSSSSFKSLDVPKFEREGASFSQRAAKLLQPLDVARGAKAPGPAVTTLFRGHKLHASRPVVGRESPADHHQAPNITLTGHHPIMNGPHRSAPGVGGTGSGGGVGGRGSHASSPGLSEPAWLGHVKGGEAGRGTTHSKESSDSGRRCDGGGGGHCGWVTGQGLGAICPA